MSFIRFGNSPGDFRIDAKKIVCVRDSSIEDIPSEAKAFITADHYLYASSLNLDEIQELLEEAGTPTIRVFAQMAILPHEPSGGIQPILINVHKIESYFQERATHCGNRIQVSKQGLALYAVESPEQIDQLIREATGKEIIEPDPRPNTVPGHEPIP